MKRIVLAVVAAMVSAVGMVAVASAQWPVTCVELNDIVEAHLGNTHNVGIYQSTFGEGAEQGCQNDHRDDVQEVFAWAGIGEEIIREVEVPIAPAPISPISSPPRHTHSTDFATGQISLVGGQDPFQARQLRFPVFVKSGSGRAKWQIAFASEGPWVVQFINHPKVSARGGDPSTNRWDLTKLQVFTRAPNGFVAYNMREITVTVTPDANRLDWTIIIFSLDDLEAGELS
ncbi:MAG: hypothetical protein OXG46_07840 [Chloroflexi bacterium]|nr:hypothetical protein [Chloroflexota bacterium]MCY3938805.1 hypothetical protein [Chloroflexota bacterium]